MSRTIKQFLPILLAIGLLGYAIKDISLTELVTQFSRADYRWIALFTVATLTSYIVRGKRWQQALLALGYYSTTFRATIAMQSGSIASMIVPGSGELTRCATIGRTDAVPMAHSVGSVVAERVLDVLMLCIVILLAFVLELSRMQEYLRSFRLMKPGLTAAVLLISSLVVGYIVYRIWRLPIVQKHPLSSRIKGFGQGVSEGFMAIRQLPSPLLFIGLTLASQVLAWLTIVLLLRSLESTNTLPATAALTILAVSSIGGLAVPTQGGIGTYHFFVSRALVLYGLALPEAVVAATFMHAVSLGVNLILSSISFLVIPFLVNRKNNPQPVTES